MKKTHINKKTKKELLKKYNVEKYLAYATTIEAFAVLFIRKYLNQAAGMWIDVIDADCPNHYEPNNLQFKKVRCELFPKTIKPQYPSRKDFESDEDYYLVCRSITYETAHEDIENQKDKGVVGKKYVVEGIRYFDKKKKKPPYFMDSAPEKIKALAKKPNDRTNPLWDVAHKYINIDYINFTNYSYKIISIRRI